MSDKAIDRIWKNSDRILVEVLDQATDEIRAEVFDSPIEEAFALAVNALRKVLYQEVDWLPNSMTFEGFRMEAALTGDEGVPEIAWRPGFCACVAPQVQIANFRVDFLVLHRKGLRGVGGIVVECDGHEFHERTKQQAARDKARDRELQYRGLKVFRFTGSEIWADPLKCAETVIEAAFSIGSDSERARMFFECGDIANAMNELRYVSRQ